MRQIKLVPDDIEVANVRCGESLLNDKSSMMMLPNVISVHFSKLFESSLYLTKNCSNCTFTKGCPFPDPNASPTNSNTNSETPKDPSMTFEDKGFLDVSSWDDETSS